MATDWKLLGPPGGGESKHSRANGLLQERWHQAVDQMRSELDSSDARRLGAFQDPSLMMDQLEQEFTAAEGAAFRRWRPILTTIEKASMLLAAALMSAQPTETKILWGLLHLILTVS